MAQTSGTPTQSGASTGVTRLPRPSWNFSDGDPGVIVT